MKKHITITSLLFLLFAVAQSGIARQLTVSPKGELQSIQEAVQQAQPHDTLRIMEGSYAEHDITIDKPLTIVGNGKVIIDGENKGYVIIVSADDVTIRDIEIHNSKVSFIEDYAGILVEEVYRTHIENTRLVDNYFGIYLAKAANAVIRNNHITASGLRETSSANGIHLWYSKGIQIQNNYISGHRDGLYFEFVEEATITGNLSEGNIRYGIHFMYSDNCRYEENTFRDNDGGVAVMYTQHVEIINNRFEDNRGSSAYGLLLKEINRSKIEDNLISNNSVGLYIEATSRNSFKGNSFNQNGWAIKLMANSTDNMFTKNNFTANTFEISTNSRQNYNEFDQNYWSQYEGYDLDRDGVGDVPHRPVRLFSVLIERQPQAILLLRSLLIDILDATERFLPALTPETLVDSNPQMNQL